DAVVWGETRDIRVVVTTSAPVAAIAAHAIVTVGPSALWVNRHEVKHGVRQRVRWAEQDLDDLGRGGIPPVRDVVAEIVVVPPLVQVVQLAIGKHLDPQVGAISPAAAAHSVGRVDPGGETAPGIVVVVGRQGELLEVVLAAHAVGGFAHLCTAGS